MDERPEHDDSFEALQRPFFSRDAHPSASEAMEPNDDPLSTDELERLYQEALRSVEAAEVFDRQFNIEETAEVLSSCPPPNSPPQEPVVATPPPTLRPRQILESVLFVGGTELTLKKLLRLLGETASEEDVEREIAALNHHYASQNRPYEIRFGEGGFRMILKSEFERIRNRVYGVGPKDVRLSQDLLEVLALVAYRQPLSKVEIEEHRPGAGPHLNQLLRRELIALERTGKTRDDVQYITTPRFLQLFGLGDLRELPHPDDLTFK